MPKYRRTMTPKKTGVTYDQLLRVHRLVYRQTLRLSRLEERIESLERELDQLKALPETVE